MKKGIILGTVFISLILGGFLLYWFFFRKTGNKVRMIEPYIERYQIERNEGVPPVKTRIQTRAPVNGEENPPVPISIDNFYIQKVFIFSSNGDRTVVMRDNRSVSNRHTIKDDDTLGMDLYVHPDICPVIDPSLAKKPQFHGCTSTVFPDSTDPYGKKEIDGVEYQGFVQNEETTFGELNVIEEGNMKYYEFPIPINADNTLIYVIEENDIISSNTVDE